MTETNPASITTLERLRLARAPGILFLTAALLVPLSGAVAFDAATPDALIAPAPDEPAAPADEPTTARAAAESSAASAVDAIPAPDLRTGDRLDDDQRAAFAAWIAQEQAAGRHRGFAFY